MAGAPLTVSAIALVGREHEWLATILRQWLDDGFITEGGEVELAEELLERLPDPARQRPLAAGAESPGEAPDTRESHPP